jgi:hypothetical protein
MPLLKRVLLIFVCLFFFGAKNILATCDVSSSTYYFSPDVTTDNIAVTLKNTGTTPISWIKIPGSYSSVLAITSTLLQEDGWTFDSGTGDYVYSGGTLSSGDSLHFTLSIQTTGERTMDLVWQASEDIPESTPEDCSPFSIEIITTIPTPEPTPTPTPPPAISATHLTVGNSSATLTWTTDLAATGTVSYGTTASYGSTAITISGTSHSASLQSLSASTLYHYKIVATGTGGTTTTTDATFTTSAADVTTTTTTTVTTTTTITITPSPTPPPPRDIIAPIISI